MRAGSEPERVARRARPVSGVAESARRGRRGGTPFVVILGEAQRTRAVVQALRPLRLRLETRQSVHEVADADLSAVAALVLAPPLQGASAERAVALVRNTRRDLPVFVLTRDDAPDRDVARLYRRGATAVFAWPLEERLFPAFFEELVGAEAREPTGSRDADRALERAIRARLRLLGRGGRGVRIAAQGGRVRLAGPVERLWKARSLENDVARVPGVRSVDARGLEVEPSGLRDRDIARSLRVLLKGASSIDDATLSISVHDGHVVLLGTVSSSEEWQHTLELFALVDGVRSVTNRTRTEAQRKRADRSLAAKLQARVRVMVPGTEHVQVAVLGGVGVLRGRVRLLSTRREVEELVAVDPAVERVVDKIEVEDA